MLFYNLIVVVDKELASFGAWIEAIIEVIVAGIMNYVAWLVFGALKLDWWAYIPLIIVDAAALYGIVKRLTR